MGKERARATTALGHQILAVFDPDPSRAETLAADYCGPKISRTIEEIPWHELDAMFICTPPSFRAAYQLSAVDAGLPFFVEKPIAVHASDCLTVLTALQRRPILHAVGYMNRCRHSIRAARELLQSAETLGACCHWVGRKYRVDWWLQDDKSGGPVNEQATHVFDLFRFLVGEISAVAATMPVREKHDEPQLRVACAVNFSAGPVGTIFYSCEAADKHIDLRIITTRGILEFAGWDLRLVANSINGKIPAAAEEDIFINETAKFLDAVERHDPALVACDLFDAFRTQLAVDAARSSLHTGQLVKTESDCHHETAV
jgi:myo-inositol 2-dehydrogenase / D-chiro-inositol 1-dehydrogenase